uniref:Uncharacterized protein n=1 Tax=Cacopsylla melanoneura TaxID=428564 RepID=A0A8D8YQH2_9HEMI
MYAISIFDCNVFPITSHAGNRHNTHLILHLFQVMQDESQNINTLKYHQTEYTGEHPATGTCPTLTGRCEGEAKSSHQLLLVTGCLTLFSILDTSETSHLTNY